MSDIRTIPLALLSLSPLNVRKYRAAGIEGLAASILAHGLIQNLTVLQSAGGYAVVAGGRRFAALQLLASDGRLPPALADVPCLLVDVATAHEISIAENSNREAMHPADQFDAFQELAAEGHGVPEIAARFGYTERHVQQLLKLARVAPSLLATYREGGIELEQLQALALSDDQAEQVRVWKKAESWNRRPDTLRQAITNKMLDAKRHNLAAYVGREAYVAAGGVVVSNLFGEDEYFPDIELVEKLAAAKMEKHAAKVRKEGWSWVEIRSDFDYSARAKFGQTHEKTAEVKAYAGAVVFLDYYGKIESVRGLIRAGDLPAGKSKNLASSPPAAKPSRKDGALPFAHVQRLQGARTAVLRAKLATQPRIAMAALAACLGLQFLRRHTGVGFSDYDPGIVQIARSSHVSDRNVREGLEGSLADDTLKLIETEWVDRLKPVKADIFGWLLQQSELVTHELLGFLAAREIMAADAIEQRADRGLQFMLTAGVDVDELWTPGEEWLAQLPKDVILAAVTEACGKAVAAGMATKKKAQLAKMAADALDGTGWLPKPLRGPSYALAKPKAVRAPKAAA